MRRPVSNYWEEGGWTHVPYFMGLAHCPECGGRKAIDYRSRQEPVEPKRYRVLVDDNFRFGREGESWQAGEFDDYDEAVTLCREIVDDNLRAY